MSGKGWECSWNILNFKGFWRWRERIRELFFYSSIIYIIKECKWEQFSFREIKDLIESNLRQRVLGNTNPVKLGRCFHFLNDWYGFHQGNGSNQHKQNEKVFNIAQSDEPSTQKELAQSYGITQQTMNNYMRMASMIPELEDLVDTGIVTKTTTLVMMKNLSTDGQRELISHLETPCYIYLYDYSIIKDYTG